MRNDILLIVPEASSASTNSEASAMTNVIVAPASVPNFESIRGESLVAKTTKQDDSLPWSVRPRDEYDKPEFRERGDLLKAHSLIEPNRGVLMNARFQSQ